MLKLSRLFITTFIFAITISKADSAQIYTYNPDNLSLTDNTYHDHSITSENNKCLDGLLKRLPQNGDRETTEACLNTFGYNPDTNITSPVMIVFEVGKPSQTITTTIIYKIKNKIIQEKFQAVGARYQQWYPEAGMYTLDYIKSDNSPSFKPAYANFYSPKGKKDKNGNPVNIGLHGRAGNLMAGGGSNGCYRHRVEDMQRFMTIIKKAGADANLPPNWYQNTLPVAFVSRNLVSK
ncbi:L,D-transpeptidase [Calothrix sp. HK-06]|nr:L,D-transpeptidase [Calothrix sp. HK-06]